MSRAILLSLLALVIVLGTSSAFSVSFPGSSEGTWSAGWSFNWYNVPSNFVNYGPFVPSVPSFDGFTFSNPFESGF